MNNLLHIAALFVAGLTFGSAIILPLFPLKVTGKSFQRFYYGFITFLFGLFLLSLYRLNLLTPHYYVYGALSLWITILSFRNVQSKMETVLHWVFAVIAVNILLTVSLGKSSPHTSLSLIIEQRFLFISLAIFLSFSIMNMIFGHWYLVNRDLPIKHLIKTSKNLIYVTYARAATVGVATYWAFHSMDTSTFNRLTMDFMGGHAIFYWGRILAGLGLPILVAHLSYESAKIKSNQSATGILYAGNVFVIMGELFALYLFGITGIMF